MRITTIYKYRVPFPSGRIEMPQHATVLTLQMQGGAPTLWAWVDPQNTMEYRRFQFYGTGHRITDDPGTYVGTVQDSQGFVWHLFDTGP